MPVTTSEARQFRQEIQWQAAFPPPFPHSMYHTKDVLHHEHERKEDDSVVSVIDHLTQGRLYSSSKGSADAGPTGIPRVTIVDHNTSTPATRASQLLYQPPRIIPPRSRLILLGKQVLLGLAFVANAVNPTFVLLHLKRVASLANTLILHNSPLVLAMLYRLNYDLDTIIRSKECTTCRSACSMLLIVSMKRLSKFLHAKVLQQNTTAQIDKNSLSMGDEVLSVNGEEFTRMKNNIQPVLEGINVTELYHEWYYFATSRELKRLDAVSKSPIFTWSSESLAGQSTIRAYNHQSLFIATNSRLNRSQMYCLPSMHSNLTAVMNSNVDAGLVELVLSYALSTTGSLNWLVRSASEVEQNVVSVKRIVHCAKELPSDHTSSKTAPMYRKGTLRKSKIFVLDEGE
ncbi:hypothetical protein SCLCIDRAFT_27629 [Scleroderma citrinum Foug A]|uniref:Uncharacterized protein n=1 Tax=Scleroderma citrinum Foug A TaxID=1036808 RepID=A0A0C3A315_9AGAM|nr:hypothetical protein SCLCIDRAFT_27629 [Scleroderma citrinum Foug A]